MAVIFLKPLFTEIGKDNCFSTYTRSDLNKIRGKPLKSMIWLTDEIMRNFKNRSLQNFQTWQFIHTSLSLSKQQRNGLNGPLKVWIMFPYLRRKVELCCFLLTRQVYSQKGLSCPAFFAWSVDKNDGLVARGKTSSFCTILFPIYLKRISFANFCF